VVAPFSIPSESMLPGLFVGDYLLVAKWPYGWSRHSLPWSPPVFSGRLFGKAPARGDIVVFRNPANDHANYIKRVIGLPGDRVQMRDGSLLLNGKKVPQLRVADLLVPVSPNSPCPTGAGRNVALEREEGGVACRYHRYREILPGGRSYDIVDVESDGAADDTAEFRVPAGQYFLLGDNRDRSGDSRFPASAEGGIGFVPADDLVGRAGMLFFSTDGRADWLRPWTWWPAARPERVGQSL
jgi:signal peptidase I